MASENIDPSSMPNGDDLLRDALSNIASGSGINEQFGIVDNTIRYTSIMTARREMVLGSLASEMTSAERLHNDLIRLKAADPKADYYDLMKQTYDSKDQAREENIGEPRTRDLAHLAKLLMTITDIARESFYTGGTPSSFWATKAGIQAAVLEESLFANEDRAALIAATEQFLKGDPFDPTDPLQVAKAHIELNQDHIEDAHELYQKTGRAVDNFLAKDNEIDTLDEKYPEFRRLVQDMINSDGSTNVSLVLGYLDHFKLSEAALYSFLRRWEDPDRDDDSD